MINSTLIDFVCFKWLYLLFSKVDFILNTYLKKLQQTILKSDPSFEQLLSLLLIFLKSLWHFFLSRYSFTEFWYLVSTERYKNVLGIFLSDFI